ncbi:MAG: pyridoxamine 5'-phosphate oxidase [Myxococcota bacterium]
MSALPPSSPFPLFGQWFSDASQAGLREPTAMTIATVDDEGQPSVRVVLLKSWDERGFVFFTNLESRKGRDLEQNQRVALCFHWDPLKRQVRVRGHVEPVTEEEADAYFHSRPRESQLGAWTSLQSAVLRDRAELEERYALFQQRYPGPIPRPPHWSGLRVVPQDIEFWREGDFRLHHRDLYSRFEDEWRHQLLYP